MTDPKFTIPVSATASTHSPDMSCPVGKQLKPESIEEKIKRLFLQPFEKLNAYDDGYLILILSMALYEKWLRVKTHEYRIRTGKSPYSGFPKGDPAYEHIAKHFSITEDEAYEFWQMFRNGLLHRALPRKTDGFSYELNTSGTPIRKEGKCFYLDILAIKKVLLPLIQDPCVWQDDQYALLPETYEPL
jgi:hypothetical protein